MMFSAALSHGTAIVSAARAIVGAFGPASVDQPPSLMCWIVGMLFAELVPAGARRQAPRRRGPGPARVLEVAGDARADDRAVVGGAVRLAGAQHPRRVLPAPERRRLRVLLAREVPELEGLVDEALAPPERDDRLVGGGRQVRRPGARGRDGEVRRVVAIGDQVLLERGRADH